MYHIPDDRRSKRSAECVFESLISMGKAPDEVSVTALAQHAGVGRSTFYRLFDNVSDVVRWKCCTLMEEALGKASGASGFDGIFLSFIASWIGQPEFMSLLLRSSLTDILMETHLDHIEEIGNVFFKDKELSGRDGEFLAVLLSSMLSGAFRLYENRPLPSPEEILVRFKAALGDFCLMFSVKGDM